MEWLKILSDYSGFVLTIVSLTVLIFKPLRTIFVNWLNRITNTNQQNVLLENIQNQNIQILAQNEELKKELNNKINELSIGFSDDINYVKTELGKHKNAHILSIRNIINDIYDEYHSKQIIPDCDKKKLIECYEVYLKLNGNSYIASRVKELCKKFNITFVEYNE